MILASAVKFKVPRTGKEVILCGSRHGDIFKQLSDLGLRPRELEELEQGFIDQYNKFYSRVAAYEEAERCGQLCANILYKDSHKLFSEDLW